jgi:DNA topoisomerase IB
VDGQAQRRAVDSSDVNAYLRASSGHEFTAKDFRTWAGTVLAALALEGVTLRSLPARGAPALAGSSRGLRPSEIAVLGLLEQRLAREVASRARAA